MVLSFETKRRLALWLVPGLGPKRINRLLNAFGDSDSIFNASTASLTRVEGISKILASLIQNANNCPALDQECQLIEKYQLNLFSPADCQYPNLLKEIHTNPPVIYLKGGIDFNQGLFIGVVGSRKASYSGKSFCKKLIKHLAQISNDITIVSGLALGIDAVAHKAAMENGLKTIAVMAGGLSEIYPSQHKELSRRISECGALVTEFPIMTKPSAGNFPLRNRIISGVSKGVVVIEAGERSGALITAGFALEQNRELFALPGQVDSSYYRGTNRLIQRGQAKLVLEAQDIIEELQPALLSTNSNSQSTDPSITKGLTPDEMLILKQLENRSMHRDVLANELNMPLPKCLAVLTTLEIKGLIISKAGSQFERTDCKIIF